MTPLTSSKQRRTHRLGCLGFQITDYEPVGEKSHKKNDSAKLKPRNIGTAAPDQQSHRQWRHDSGEISREVFSSSPYPDFLEGRAALKNYQQIAGRKPDQ